MTTIPLTHTMRVRSPEDVARIVQSLDGWADRFRRLDSPHAATALKNYTETAEAIRRLNPDVFPVKTHN